ncbi:hypothetical protein GPL15_19735 [Clostridium sp. MCC353]|uniref:four-carbon acid sugar kinase family protein n=1 Tax=Clostridium sp. MCC353 TaxID=2592646 RepID=UPI001C017A0F|nr:four-carbon acid sugar kinase family protein [Clostridium sp. MCC353]MBT9778721.1 hypothetical protein [Clostridium sp. MCC353]
MVKVLVIADDFTGANDTGSLLREKGFRTFSTHRNEISRETRENYEAVCLCTNSRSANPSEAGKRVRQAAERYLEEGMLISKRIDSTLRGNVGKEIEGALEAVPEGWKAVVVPVSPRAGRICVGGYILVHGVPLSKSDAARDPRTPVREEKAVDIIRKQTERAVGYIPLECVHQKAEAVAKRLRETECSIVVADAADMDDIREIARGCMESGLPVICVDPGDFTVETARLRYKLDGETDKRNLLVVGSLSKQAREQLDYMKERKDICLYRIDLENLLLDSAGETERARTFLEREGGRDTHLGITTAYSKRIAVESDSEEGRATAERIADALAKMALDLLSLEALRIGLVYVSGGDVAMAFAERAGMEGIEPLGEMSPLAVYGTIIGGTASGMRILTKGGMIGERDTVYKMLSGVKMMNRINEEERE